MRKAIGAAIVAVIFFGLIAGTAYATSPAIAAAVWLFALVVGGGLAFGIRLLTE